MTRALGIAVASAATLAVIVVGFLLFPTKAPRHRREPVPVAATAPSPWVHVLAGQTADRAIVFKERYADAGRAAFTDTTLAEKLGARPRHWRFVEVWVVNRGQTDVRSLQAVPAVAGPGGAPVVLKPLRDLAPLSSGGRAAAMLVQALAPDASEPLRKGAFRRTVYAMEGATSFRDLVSADVDGVRLVPCETTEAALETFLERPRPDLIAALARPEELK